MVVNNGGYVFMTKFYFSDSACSSSTGSQTSSYSTTCNSYNSGANSQLYLFTATAPAIPTAIPGTSNGYYLSSTDACAGNNNWFLFYWFALGCNQYGLFLDCGTTSGVVYESYSYYSSNNCSGALSAAYECIPQQCGQEVFFGQASSLAYLGPTTCTGGGLTCAAIPTSPTPSPTPTPTRPTPSPTPRPTPSPTPLSAGYITTYYTDSGCNAVLAANVVGTWRCLVVNQNVANGGAGSSYVSFKMKMTSVTAASITATKYLYTKADCQGAAAVSQVVYPTVCAASSSNSLFPAMYFAYSATFPSFPDRGVITTAYDSSSECATATPSAATYAALDVCAATGLYTSSMYTSCDGGAVNVLDFSGSSECSGASTASSYLAVAAPGGCGTTRTSQYYYNYYYVDPASMVTTTCTGETVPSSGLTVNLGPGAVAGIAIAVIIVVCCCGGAGLVFSGFCAGGVYGVRAVMGVSPSSSEPPAGPKEEVQLSTWSVNPLGASGGPSDLEM